MKTVLNNKKTMEDVARLSGVSKSTVSRVLNDHPDVKEKTRRIVLEAMRELDYKPKLIKRRST